LKILVVMLVNWIYGCVFITIVAFIWFYIGAANPAVKPGLAKFRFLGWIKSLCLRAFGLVSIPLLLLLIVNIKTYFGLKINLN